MDCVAIPTGAHCEFTAAAGVTNMIGISGAYAGDVVHLRLAASDASGPVSFAADTAYPVLPTTLPIPVPSAPVSAPPSVPPITPPAVTGTVSGVAAATSEKASTSAAPSMTTVTARDAAKEAARLIRRRSRVLLFTNAERATAGLRGADGKRSADPVGAALRRAPRRWIGRSRTSDGSTLTQRVVAAGYRYRFVGENLGLGQQTAKTGRGGVDGQPGAPREHAATRGSPRSASVWRPGPTVSSSGASTWVGRPPDFRPIGGRPPRRRRAAAVEPMSVRAKREAIHNSATVAACRSPRADSKAACSTSNALVTTSARSSARSRAPATTRSEVGLAAAATERVAEPIPGRDQRVDGADAGRAGEIDGGVDRERGAVSTPSSRATARSTSTESTLVVPSQIGSTCASRSSRGMPVSSTYPAPPKHSRYSDADATAQRAGGDLRERCDQPQLVGGTGVAVDLDRAEQRERVRRQCERGLRVHGQASQRGPVQRVRVEAAAGDGAHRRVRAGVVEATAHATAGGRRVVEPGHHDERQHPGQAAGQRVADRVARARRRARSRRSGRRGCRACPSAGAASGRRAGDRPSAA